MVLEVLHKPWRNEKSRHRFFLIFCSGWIFSAKVRGQFCVRAVSLMLAQSLSHLSHYTPSLINTEAGNMWALLWFLMRQAQSCVWKIFWQMLCQIQGEGWDDLFQTQRGRRTSGADRNKERFTLSQRENSCSSAKHTSNTLYLSLPLSSQSYLCSA